MYRWILFSVLSITFIFSYFIRLSTGILGPELMRDLQMDANQLGILGGAFFYAFAIAQIPVGLALDASSPKRVIISTTLLSTLGCYLLSIAQGFNMALVGRIFIGLGMSAVLMGSLKIFNNWFRQNEFGFISGSILSLGHLGALLAAAPLVFMTLLIGWRRVFLFLGVFVIVMTVLILFFVKDTPEEKMGGRPSLGGTKRRNGKTFFSSLPVVFSSRHFWFISMSSLIRYGSLISIQGFLGPLYLIEILGYSPQESGNILSMISIGYLIGSPLAGRLSDSVFQSRKKVMLTGLSLFAILILPFLCDRSQNTIFWSTIFFGLGFSASVGAVSFAHVKELYPEEVAGLALTASNLFNIVGGGLSQHLLGIVIGSFPKTDSGYPLQAYHLTFIILFIFSTMAFLIYLGVRDTHPLQPQKPDQSSFLNGAKRT